MGFYRIIRIGRIQLDYALITAMIERWRPETHTFHLPIGEATITLQDAEILYGLSADGLPVLLLTTMRYYPREAYWDMLHMLTGFMPEGQEVASGVSRIQLVPIRDHLVQLHDTITDESAEVDVQRYTRLLLLLLFGGVLFPNTSGNLVSLRFLHHITRFEDTASYSWGGAVLSFLYRQMCRASMGTQRDVCGFLPLLQVWVWERFLQLRPPLPQLPANVDIPNLPLACRWVMRRRLAREYDAHHNLPRIRDELDLLEDAQFIWTPYIEEVIGTLPAYCTFGRHIWRASVPLTCLDIVEHHASERVFRQFGLPQPIPTPPAWHPLHYERDDRSRAR
ncbi:PREDICTED: serine/threonine-protein phosphatase 7 long form homolog [Nicotiana attenuata]|uniref:serine/threonine-protein phosphatase 7 long form homolog n=1 Tax=Nicotiana attenuata TaxID=49451 RepID=UPI000904B49D|nr:PREDICTED: serine/threonine-protein phosphatase 7 long form homolog [Nicotiana attenuata]